MPLVPSETCSLRLLRWLQDELSQGSKEEEADSKKEGGAAAKLPGKGSGTTGDGDRLAKASKPFHLVRARAS